MPDEQNWQNGVSEEEIAAICLQHGASHALLRAAGHARCWFCTMNFKCFYQQPGKKCNCPSKAKEYLQKKGII